VLSVLFVHFHIFNLTVAVPGERMLTFGLLGPEWILGWEPKVGKRGTSLAKKRKVLGMEHGEGNSTTEQRSRLHKLD